MKLFLALMIVVARIDAASEVTYVGHDKVAATLAKSGAIASSSDYLVSGSHRSGPGQVEVHANQTDVLYIVDGAATFVTGGTMIGGKASGPGQMLGTEIQGGQSHHLTKGDVIVIPAGTPHWFKEVPSSVSYFVVKVVK